MQKTTTVLLKFDAESAKKPMIYYLTRDYDLVFSILQADIRPGDDGRTILKLTGEEDNIRRALAFAGENGVTVTVLKKAIVWDDESCVHCGACTAVCTHKALTIDPVTAILSFNNENCVVCEMCVHACPTNSVHADFT